MTETAMRTLPSARPPTDAELVMWRALSREEQLSRFRQALEAPEAGRISTETMAEVLATARKRTAPPGG